MYNEKIKSIFFCCFLCTCVRALGYTGSTTQDLPSTRANTLSDDADDIQKQLDNEARDKIKYGRPKAMWIFHFPAQVAGVSTESIQRLPRQPKLLNMIKTDNDTITTPEYKDSPLYPVPDYTPAKPKEWSYKDQGNWSSAFPACAGSSQSPVDLPYTGMIATKGHRKLHFINYEAQPKSMTMALDGNTVSLYGEWASSEHPLVYGGAAHSRRYLLHSLAFRWPSDHSVGGLYYPLESQAIHVSAEYPTLEEAIQGAAKDKLALLSVANIYKYSDHNQKGLEELVKTILSTSYGNITVKPMPLELFSPPLTEYAAYHGSLPTPPCTESVLWLVRARSLPITRELADALDGYAAYGGSRQSFHRVRQPLNDRKIFFFN